MTLQTHTECLHRALREPRVGPAALITTVLTSEPRHIALSAKQSRFARRPCERADDLEGIAQTDRRRMNDGPQGLVKTLGLQG